MTRAFNALNEVVSIESVVSGLACECFCIDCGGELQAKKGKKNAHHFAHHANSDVANSCRWTPESELHQIAKEVIREDKFAMLPIGTINPKLKEYVFDEVRSEVRTGKRIPDIVADYRGEAILIEIAVTHFCGPEKIRDFKRSNANVIEFDLSGYKFDGETISKDKVREILKESPAKLLSVAPVGSFAEECHQHNRNELSKIKFDAENEIREIKAEAKKELDKIKSDSKFWYGRMKRAEEITYSVSSVWELLGELKKCFRHDKRGPSGKWEGVVEVHEQSNEEVRDSLPVSYRKLPDGEVQKCTYGEMSERELKSKTGLERLMICAAFTAFRQEMKDKFFSSARVQDYAAICKHVYLAPISDDERYIVHIYVPEGFFADRFTDVSFYTILRTKYDLCIEFSVQLIEVSNEEEDDDDDDFNWF